MTKDRKQKKKEKQKAAEDRRKREIARQQQAIARQLEEARSRPRPEPEARPEVQPAGASSLSEPSPLEPSPGEEDELWDRFESAGLEGKEEIFLQALAQDELDEEYAFEMLSDLHRQMDRTDPAARDRFAGLVYHLRDQAPELYRQSIQYYNDMLIEDAIAAGDWEAVPAFLEPFSDPAYADTFSRIQEKLEYHGQGKLLIPVMIEALPKQQDSEAVFDWVAEEVGGKLMHFILDEYLETTSAPQAGDPALLEATAPYGRWQEGWLERFVPRLAAAAPSPWSPDDFGPAVDADRWSDNLNNLLAEFSAGRRRAGVPYSRSRMAWEFLEKALEDQLAGGSLPKEKASKHGKKSKGRGVSPPQEQPAGLTAIPLIPAYRQMDRTLGSYFRFMSAQPYQAAAVVELLPAYLHFLARLGLIHPSEMDRALGELAPLGKEILPPLQSYGVDPQAVQNVRDAWAPEALEQIKNDPALAGARAQPPLAQITSPPVLARKSGEPQAYTFKVTYLRDPEVWRTIEMLGKHTLDDLHEMIQVAVSFDNDHLYSFYMNNRAWDKDMEFADPRARERRSAARVRIEDLNLRMKQRFLYIFDYGDEHRFEVQLVEVNPIDPKAKPEAKSEAKPEAKPEAKTKYPRVVESHGEDPSQYGFEEDDDWEDGEDWDEDELEEDLEDEEDEMGDEDD